MDELQIEGKRYISSRRAAKENKYHVDYIGQLIRTGKITGRKVGRSWYVGVDSLKSYLSQEGGSVEEREVAPTPVVAEAVVEEKISEEPVVEEVVEEVVVATSAPVEKPVEEKRTEQKITQPVSVFMHPTEPALQKKSSNLVYLEDNEPLLPSLEERTNADFISIPMRRIETPEESVEEKEEVLAPEPEIVVRRERPIRTLSVLAFTGILVLVAVAAGSSLVASSIVVAEGQPATVGFTLK